MRFYLGTYTGPQSKGIYCGRLEPQSGQITGLDVAAQTPNPSFLELSPDGRFLYCANEVGSFDGRKTGSLSAFAIESATGQLSLLNQQPSEGAAPCYLCLDADGRHALVANYSSGSVALLPILCDGSLQPASSRQQHEGKGPTSRQTSPHAHSIRLDPSGRFAIAADLGLDRLFIYRLDLAAQTLTPHGSASVAPGAGCRHTAFDPSGKHLYVINELDGTLSAFAWNAQAGTLEPIMTTPTLPPDFSGSNLGAEIQVHPSGRFVYASNRGHDSIAIFATDAATGRLQFIAHEPTRGKHPRHFSLSPDGKWMIVANKDSNNLTVFGVDLSTGRLTHLQTAQAPSPVCVRFVR